MTLPALVITAEFWHETNTFNHRLTALQDMTVLDGEEALAERGSTNTELAGFLVAAGRHSWNLTHVLSVMGNPAGRLLDRDFWEVLKRIEAAVGHARQKGGPSGILVALHGSLSTESLDDGDGAFLNRLRDVAGPDVPIVATLDLHANVSAQMAAAVDALVSYKTYPHIDMLETGNKAGNVLDKLMREKCRGRVLIARRPMLEEASGGRTDMPLMEARLAKAADHETSHADALDVSINAGMAWADVANIGPSVTASVLSGTREAPHQALIQSLADDIWEHRQHQSHHFLDPAEAAARAAAHSADRAPLVISDYTDNPGAGAPGDATNLLAALLKAGVRNACLGGLVDPEAVKVLEHYSIGDRVTLDIGGRCSPHHGGGPVTVSGRLSCISAGPSFRGAPSGRVCRCRLDRWLFRSWTESSFSAFRGQYSFSIRSSFANSASSPRTTRSSWSSRWIISGPTSPRSQARSSPVTVAASPLRTMAGYLTAACRVPSIRSIPWSSRWEPWRAGEWDAALAVSQGNVCR
jgi:microcystin degradation protein MlrC